jgi:hypothetical protein
MIKAENHLTLTELYLTKVDERMTEAEIHLTKADDDIINDLESLKPFNSSTFFQLFNFIKSTHQQIHKSTPYNHFLFSLKKVFTISWHSFSMMPEVISVLGWSRAGLHRAKPRLGSAAP